MNVGYCAFVPMIQTVRKWLDLAAQYCGHVASRKKDAKLYIAKGSPDADKYQGQQSRWSTGYPLVFTTIHIVTPSKKKNPEAGSFSHQLTTSHPNTKQWSGLFFYK